MGVRKQFGRALAEFQALQFKFADRATELEAARLLLLLNRDVRFTAKDAAAVRDATRLWHKPDLVSYIDVGDLSGDDPEKRKEMARFLGEAGIEALFEPGRRLGAHAEPDRRAAHGHSVEAGRLEQQRGRIVLDHRAFTTHDAGQRHGTSGVADQQVR